MKRKPSKGKIHHSLLYTSGYINKAFNELANTDNNSLIVYIFFGGEAPVLEEDLDLAAALGGSMSKKKKMTKKATCSMFISVTPRLVDFSYKNK